MPHETEHEAATPDGGLYPHHYVGIAFMWSAMIMWALLAVAILPALLGVIPLTISTIGLLSLATGILFFTGAILTATNTPLFGEV